VYRMNRATAQRMGKWGIVRDYPDRTLVFSQGWESDTVYYIHDGVIKLTSSGSSGMERIVGLRWPGWFLGAAPAICRREYPVSALTLRPSRVESIDSTSFISLLHSDEELTWRVHQSHSVEIADALLVMGQVLSLPAPQRFAKYIRHLISSQGSTVRSTDGRLILPLTKSELSQLIGVDRATLSRILGDLARRGVINLAGC